MISVGNSEQLLPRVISGAAGCKKNEFTQQLTSLTSGPLVKEATPPS